MTTPPKTEIHPAPDRILVPRQHAQILLEPPLAHSASALLAPTAPPSPSAAKKEFLAAANLWAAQIGAPPIPDSALQKPWVITGHQVEFFHAGVWAKMIATDELARRTAAIPFDLLVDHDVVDHLGFDVPILNPATNSWQRQSITWSPPSLVPADGLLAPTPSQFDQWDAALAAHPHAQSDALAHVLTALRTPLYPPLTPPNDPPHPPLTPSFPPPSPPPYPYTKWMSHARFSLESSLGIHVHHVPTSLLCSTPSWHQFVQSWIQNAPAWTAIYNQKLQQYRLDHGLKNPQQPMPNLLCTNTLHEITYELPFWIYLLGQPRQRLLLRQTPTATTLLYNNAPIPPQSASTYNIRPRALTLTMFVRLHLADLFVHGIGGTLYDQITDAILQEIAHQTPSYMCVSAAWLLPLGQAYIPENIPALRTRRHHAKHNPQLVIDPFTALHTDVAELLLLRRQLVANLLPPSADKPLRRQWFDQLHEVNAALHAKAPRILANLDHQLRDAQEHAQQNHTLLWREWYFPLHSLDSLQKLISKIRATP